MILGNVTPILHAAPRSPIALRILARVPNALAPNDVFDVKSPVVLHHPFGNGATRRGRDLSRVS